jgi:hypothetical protein
MEYEQDKMNIKLKSKLTDAANLRKKTRRNMMLYKMRFQNSKEVSGITRRISSMNSA